MVCPRCKEWLPDGTEVCEVCGKKLKKKGFQLFKKKNKTTEVQPQPKLGLIKSKKMKIALLAVLVAAIAVIVIILLVNAASGKGLKTAKDLRQYIGKDIITTSIKDIDFTLSDKSNFDMVNHTTAFDYLVESEDGVKVDGLNVPEWLVTIGLNDNKEIVDVIYTDFTVLKDNIKGEKIKSAISLKDVSIGEDYKEVSDLIGLDAYRIRYDSGTATYYYKYYYENSSGDEQSVLLEVVFNNKDKFISFTSTDLYPEF